MADGKVDQKTTAADLIAELQKLPPDAEVVTSHYGWEGPQLGPVTIVSPIDIVDLPGGDVSPPDARRPKAERTVYLLDTPA